MGRSFVKQTFCKLRNLYHNSEGTVCVLFIVVCFVVVFLFSRVGGTFINCSPAYHWPSVVCLFSLVSLNNLTSNNSYKKNNFH